MKYTTPHHSRAGRARKWALALGAGASVMALSTATFAQEAATADEDITTVVITGVRASQLKSVGIKRREVAIVDAISSEDIGKLPDTTITDSLQRVPGVQIRRDAGEGSTVDLRGLSQVITLMNGEQYLSAGNLGSAQPNLLDVPSQLMNSVVVYKSTDPTNVLSGISGTIDLQTRRPFQFREGLTLAGAIEGQRGSHTKSDDHLINGLVSWRNDKAGILLSAATSDVTLGNNYSGVSQALFGNNDWGGSAPNNFLSPHGYDSFHRENQRKRTGFNASFEGKIGDSYTLIVEGFYAKLEDYNRAVGLNISNRWDGAVFGTWTQPTDFSDTGVTGGNGRPWVSVDEYDINAHWINSFTVNRTNTSESHNYNLELKYDNGGKFTYELRAISAEANRLSMNGQVQGDLSNWGYAPGRFTLFRQAADRTRGTFYSKEICDTFDASRRSNSITGAQGGCYLNPNPEGYGENPQLHYDISGKHPAWSGFDTPITGGLGAGKTLTDYMANLGSYAVGAFSSENNNEADSRLKVLRFDGHYEYDDRLFGLFNKTHFGLRHSERDTSITQFHLFSDFYAGKPDQNGVVQSAGCAAQWKAIDVVMDNPRCARGEMVPHALAGQLDPDGDPYPATIFQPYTVNRPTRLDEYNNPIFVTDLGGITSGLPGFWAADPRDFDDAVGFMQNVFGGANRVIIPGQSYDVSLEESNAYVAGDFEVGKLKGNAGLRYIKTKINVRQNVTDPTQYPYGDTNEDIGDVFDTNSYSDILPSLNLVYDYSEKLRFRFAAAKTMQPLDLGSYGGGLSITTSDDQTLGIRIATGASQGGNPQLAPWRAKNFDLSAEYYLGRASLVNVAVFYIDIASFVTGGQTTGEFPDQDGVIRRTVPVNLPVQGDGGKVQGIELSGKFSFDDFIDTPILRNFGVDTNYTFSPSKELRRSMDGDRLPFMNNSKHQYNLVGWYQDDKLQVRVAYNYRSARYMALNTLGGDNLPTYQDKSAYVDVNATYELTPQVALYVNGSNITGEIEDYYYQFADGKTQFAFQNEYEPRVTFGLRAKW
ncbi:TonB-dependent receptor [Asticcacaulis tiandongensis]|uniref:TonB-dependent receptor n=1 Tax=Asticcacaulis tiandongensis TaxID=2565365 RepID=UPI00112E20BD|nr:TonB-dependent receptor [Asticcacaulis tiandongensis]